MQIERVGGSLRGWTWNEKEYFLGNPNFGRIQVVSVCDDEGREVYQQPVWVDQRAEMDVIANVKGEVAFVEIH